jgi:predicted transcriptional regulator
MSAIFEHSSHFSYLSARLAQGRAARGTKSRFASFLRIQPAFLSQVLAQKYSLSLEQADLANQFFDHSFEEAEFFLLLVSRDRAGTPSLRKHFDQQLKSALKKRLLVAERIGKRTEISHEAKGVYYSSWLYAAVHIACTIGSLRSRRTIAEELQLPLATVGRVLDFLEENGLVRKEEDAYLPTEAWVRIDKESPHLVKHHTNWRMRAVQNLEVATMRDLHFSGVYSLDLPTALKVKDHFLDYIKEQIKRIEGAKEEELFVMGVDFFQLTKK